MLLTHRLTLQSLGPAAGLAALSGRLISSTLTRLSLLECEQHVCVAEAFPNLKALAFSCNSFTRSSENGGRSEHLHGLGTSPAHTLQLHSLVLVGHCFVQEKQGLRHLARYGSQTTSLQAVVLHCDLSDSDICSIVKASPYLTHADFSHARHLSPQSLLAFASLSCLEVLRLRDCTRVGLEHTCALSSALPRLRVLDLDVIGNFTNIVVPVTNAELASLCTYCPLLEELRLSWRVCKGMDDIFGVCYHHSFSFLYEYLKYFAVLFQFPTGRH